jgi:hypothetical protein
MWGTCAGFVQRANNVRNDDVHCDVVTEVNKMVIVGGGSVIYAIIGSEGALTDGTESSRLEDSGT